MKFQQKLTSARIAGQQLTATSGDMATWDYFLNNKFRLSATLPTVFESSDSQRQSWIAGFATYAQASCQGRAAKKKPPQ
jgi:hypothetical protein